MVGEPHRVPELRAVHDPRLERRIGVQRATQLAVDGAVRAEVDPLADQRRAPATGAALALRIAVVNGPPDQRHLERRGPPDGKMPVRHPGFFGNLRGVPARLERGLKLGM